MPPPAGYGYYKTFPINGTVAGAQALYQMKLTVYKGSGSDSAGVVYLNTHCQDDFDDIRFTTSDGETLLDFWIESMVVGTSAVFWIEFDSIPASPDHADFYIYYSNAGAIAASDGTTTFLIFDHFDDASLGPQWTVYGTAPTESGTILSIPTRVGDNNYIYSAAYARPKRIRSSTQFNLAVGDWQGFGFWMATEFNWWCKKVTAANFYCQSYDTGSSQYQDSGVAKDANYHIFEVLRISATSVKFLLDNVQMAEQTNAAYNGDSSHRIIIANGPSSGGTVNVDWVFYANLASPEPTWGAWGSETATGTAWTLSLSDSIAIADSISKAMGIARSETVGVVDTIAKGMGIAKTENIGVVDTISKGPSLKKTDSVAITESLVKNIGVRKTDTVSLADRQAKALGIAKIDTVAVTDSIAKAPSLSKADTIGIVDFISKRINLNKSDIVPLSDKSAKTIGVTRTDTVTVTDAVSKGVGMTRADTIVITDAISKSIALVRAETIAIVDSFHFFTARTKQTWTLIAKLGNRIPWQKRR